MRTRKMPPENSTPDIPPGQPAIDVEILNQLRIMLGQDTPQMMAGLIENYLENTPKMLKKLRQAANEGNKDECYDIAHSLKSCSIAFGAVRLGALCEELKTQGLIGIAENLSQIEIEYERVKLVLEVEWRRLYELRLKTDVFYPTGSYKNIGFYPK